MELVACICIYERNVPMHKINAFARLNKYMARETRRWMRRYAIVHAVYQCRLARVLVARMHRFAVPYENKYTQRINIQLYDGYKSYDAIPLTAKPHRFVSCAFSDITIVASERIYLPGCSPTDSWLTINRKLYARVTMQEIRRNTPEGVQYKYRMRLPTRHNPICMCCVGISRIGFVLEKNYLDVVPVQQLQKIITCVKIKFKVSSEPRQHESVALNNLFTRTFALDTQICKDDAVAAWRTQS